MESSFSISKTNPSLLIHTMWPGLEGDTPSPQVAYSKRVGGSTALDQWKFSAIRTSSAASRCSWASVGFSNSSP